VNDLPIRPVRWRTGAAWGWLVAGLVLVLVAVIGHNELGWIYLLSGIAWMLAAGGYIFFANRRNRAADTQDHPASSS
jgi:hypothetical protein